MTEAGEVVLVPGRLYRVGEGGLRLVAADGSVTTHPAGSLLVVRRPEDGTPRRRRTYQTQDIRPEREG